MNKRKQAFQKRKASLDARDARLKQLVNENDLEGFKDFLTSEIYLLVKHQDYLFKKGSKELISYYINTHNVHWGYDDYREKFYPKIFKYGNLKVIADLIHRVGKYHDYSDQCEKTLIKRNELDLFLHYCIYCELSTETLKFLLKHGSGKLKENYLVNIAISEKLLPTFLSIGKIEDIEWYFSIHSHLKYSQVEKVLVKLPLKRQEKIKALKFIFI